MDNYFQKIEHLETDLTWNIPEKKQGSVNIVGGHLGRFNTEIKISEFILGHYPLQDVHVVLPASLQANLPALPHLVFLPTTEAGSFADADSLVETFNTADFNFILGDFSKNSITMHAVASASGITDRPLLFARDSLDLLAEAGPEIVLTHEQVYYFASLPQLQKLLRAVYYPKMLLLSQPLLQIADVLHKFTLSYPAKIITLASDQILLAENGLVRAVALSKSGYLPFTFWSGELAAKILALNLYNPNHFLDASLTAIFTQPS